MRTRQYIVVIVLLMPVAVALQVWRDRGWTPYEPLTAVMWVKPGPELKRMALGFDALVADGYWIRAVVYFGRQRLSENPNKNYDLLYPLLDAVTLLDPRFTVAYRFGSIFLSERFPGGPGRPDLAIELLKRGLERSPERWEYAHDIGFVYYWTYRDFKTAAEWFERASQVPGAPFWLQSTAASMLTEGGDRDSARRLWQQMYDTAELDWLKKNAELRLAQLDALEAIDTLNLIVWRYEARTGRFPASWQELVQARILARVPLDPAGVPFMLDPVNEDVRIASNSLLWPLPQGLHSSAR